MTELLFWIWFFNLTLEIAINQKLWYWRVFNEYGTTFSFLSFMDLVIFFFMWNEKKGWFYWRKQANAVNAELPRLIENVNHVYGFCLFLDLQIGSRTKKGNKL